MLAKRDVMAGRLDDLFASVDNETNIDEVGQNLKTNYLAFRGTRALVQNEMEALLNQTFHRLSLALIPVHLSDYSSNHLFEGLRLLEFINDLFL